MKKNNREEQINFIRKFIPNLKNSNGWLRGYNPLTRDTSLKATSLAISVKFNIVRDFRGDLIDFEKMTIEQFIVKLCEEYDTTYTTDDEYIDLEVVNKKQGSLTDSFYQNYYIEKPESYKQIELLSNVSDCISYDCTDYLVNKRKLDFDKISKKGYGYCTYGLFKNHVIIPFIENGVWVYYIGRNIDYTSAYRYKNAEIYSDMISKNNLVYNMDYLQQKIDVILTEGCIDADTFDTGGIATLSWSVSNIQLQKICLSMCSRVIIFPDSGYFNKTLDTAAIISKYKPTYVVNNDNGEFKDVNSMGRDRAYNLINSCNKFDYKYYL